jgi:hypothetical protein
MIRRDRYLFGLVSGFYFQASAQMPPKGIYSDVTLLNLLFFLSFFYNFFRL